MISDDSVLRTVGFRIEEYALVEMSCALARNFTSELSRR
jgi:hypothetical protein